MARSCACSPSVRSRRAGCGSTRARGARGSTLPHTSVTSRCTPRVMRRCAVSTSCSSLRAAATSRRHAPRVADVGRRRHRQVERVSHGSRACRSWCPRSMRRRSRRHHGIVANPNCVAIPLAIVLAPLQRAHGLRHVTVATYQAATGAGRGLADELEAQTRDDAAGTRATAHVYPARAARQRGARADGPWRVPTPRRR